MGKSTIYPLPEDVINSHPRVFPRYLLSPFNTEYVEINHGLYVKYRKPGLKDSVLDKYFDDKKQYSYLTKRGLEGISMVLNHLELKHEDEVCILNTSGSPYVSGSITSEIEKICKWEREINKKTKCIFVIHEFGFPAKIPKIILNSNLPIIEDCAYSLGSQNEKNNIGMLGDYTIYSFPKIFPVPYGGFVRSKKKLNTVSSVTEYSRNYLLVLLLYYFTKQKKYIKAKQKNYNKFVELMAGHGIEPRFELNKNSIPACFVFKLKQTALGDKLKIELNKKGIESTVYYGGDGFFVPSHQNLSSADIEYIYKNICQVLMLKPVIMGK